jgi:hypothetical protein
MIATIKLSDCVLYLCIAIVKICTHYNLAAHCIITLNSLPKHIPSSNLPPPYIELKGTYSDWTSKFSLGSDPHLSFKPHPCTSWGCCHLSLWWINIVECPFFLYYIVICKSLSACKCAHQNIGLNKLNNLTPSS